ncbi:MAG TPA: phage tail protein [Myxococcota bacterium]|jgi:phage tail-like protein|nr:phage tail protein [Myxococcota bacterium]
MAQQPPTIESGGSGGGGAGKRERDVTIKLKIPECIGLKIDKALIVLENAGFPPPQVRFREDYAVEDTCIEQYPAPGQLINRDIPLQLVISRKSYIRYLPSIYQKSQFLDSDFLREFLWIFQHVFGGIERRLDSLHDVFRAYDTDAQFLPWLASWVAMGLDDSWPEAKKRRLVKNAIELYKVRGTVRGVKLFVKIFTDVEPRIIENEFPLRGFRVGSTSRIGVDVIIPPVRLRHCFVVEMPVSFKDTSNEMVLKIHDIIRAERPAHTQYYLRFLSEPAAKELREFIQIGLRSGIGVAAEVVQALPEGVGYDTRLDDERARERGEVLGENGEPEQPVGKVATAPKQRITAGQEPPGAAPKTEGDDGAGPKKPDQK